LKSSRVSQALDEAARVSMAFCLILGLDNPAGNITADYIVGIFDDLDKVPYDPVEREVTPSKSKDCINSLVDTVNRACISLYHKFRAYLSPITSNRTLKVPPL
jgi:hypothetical protein